MYLLLITVEGMAIAILAAGARWVQTLEAVLIEYTHAVHTSL